jgi:hypothetical protein
MAESCKRKPNDEEKTVFYIRSALVQFFKCFLILSCIFVLVLTRKSMAASLNIGKVIAYILLACLAMVVIFMADKFAYNNLLVGLGAYFGFELLKLS